MSIMLGQSWAAVGVAVVSALAYLAIRFYASRKELRELQQETLVSSTQVHSSHSRHAPLTMLAMPSPCLTSTPCLATCVY